MGRQEYTPIPGMSLADSTNIDMWDWYCAWSIGMESHSTEHLVRECSPLNEGLIWACDHSSTGLFHILYHLETANETAVEWPAKDVADGRGQR